MQSEDQDVLKIVRYYAEGDNSFKGDIFGVKVYYKSQEVASFGDMYTDSGPEKADYFICAAKTVRDDLIVKEEKVADGKLDF